MDIKAYIETGIIESYVLGLATTEEVAEIDTLRSQYPEVEEAINHFSNMVEREAVANAITPPVDIKSKILEAIKAEESSTKFSALKPVPRTDTIIEQNRGAVVAMNNKWQMVAAASVILFIISAALNFYQLNKFNKKDQAYQALLTERNSLFANNQAYEAKYQQLANVSQMIADPKMALIKMQGLPGKGNSTATLFWDTRSKDVFVMPNKLPQPQIGRQYQLWALVDGKPVDAGILDLNCVGACKMKNIQRAQGFAITLEKEGGSTSPTLQEMYVKGSA